MPSTERRLINQRQTIKNEIKYILQYQNDHKIYIYRAKLFPRPFQSCSVQVSRTVKAHLEGEAPFFGRNRGLLYP